MATGLSKIDTSSMGGVKNLAELYQLISGSEVNTSGSTTTTSEGISQEGMNEMLKSALSNTAGLAAISQGQRTAGGYGSSVNTMLTNDLLTRTASQIAQNNKTSTVTKSPTTTTTGGITGAGAAKAASFTVGLQALKELDNLTGASKKVKDLLGGEDSATNTPSVGQTASAYSQGGPSTGVYGVDSSAAGSGGIDFSAAMGGGGDFTDSSSFDLGTYNPAPVMEADPSIDFSAVPSDMQADWQLLTEGFADGGEVNTNKQTRPNIVGTSQFNRVVDPRAGKIGGGTGDNPTKVETGTQADTNEQVSPTSISRTDSQSNITTPTERFVNPLADADFNKAFGALGRVGAMAGSRDAALLGVVGRVATSQNPGLTGVVAAGDAMTGGAVSKGLNVMETIKKPTIPNVVDTIAMANPMASLYNVVANTFGFGTIGEVAGNVEMRTRSTMSPEQQAADAEWRAGLGQQVGENVDVNATPVDGPGTIVTDETTVGSSGTGQYTNPDPTISTDATDPTGFGTMGGGNDTNLAMGGEISGPGTGTSDSISARLSDGETVVTAKTTAKVKELFGEDFFHNLEAQFNAPAAVNQKLKGRA